MDARTTTTRLREVAQDWKPTAGGPLYSLGEGLTLRLRWMARGGILTGEVLNVFNGRRDGLIARRGDTAFEMLKVSCSRVGAVIDDNGEGRSA